MPSSRRPASACARCRCGKPTCVRPDGTGMAMAAGEPAGLTRRRVLALSSGGVALLALQGAQQHAGATPESLQAAVREFTGGAELRPGRIRLELPPLAESGNSVGVAVSVDSP